MALTLTENVIRNRVNLTHENLEDIKSLSLPGTFHEKIVAVGSSLRKFTRLKSLDFSRNALESLKGFDHLQLLEKLNLYYNNVSTLEELTRLKHNPNLKELDLRLNPVTRNEPDYRLYLIHMLPNLQKLDDRGVRDRERQAALIHFSSSQAVEMTVIPSKTQTPTKGPLPRTEMMGKLMKGPSVLVDDDVAVIDIMNRNEGDFGKPRPLTGSAAKEDKVEDYSLENLKMLDKKLIEQKPSTKYKTQELGDSHVKVQTLTEVQSEPLDPQLAFYKDRYPNIMASPVDCIDKIGEGLRSDPNLLFHDQEEASSKYRGQGYFTPNPADTRGDYNEQRDYYSLKQDVQKSRRDGEERHNLSQDDLSLKNRPGHRRTNSVPGRTAQEFLKCPQQPRVNPESVSERTVLYSILNLVDRYWNGSKSLHKHPKFIELALKSLEEFSPEQEQMATLLHRVEKLEEENSALRRHLTSESAQFDSTTASEAELKISLKRAKEDMERMHKEIRHYISENRELQKRLDESLVSNSRYHNAAAASDSSAANAGIVEELQRQNEILSREVEMMRGKTKQYSQVQELASMLQESHKSLVQTNDHLLKEMYEVKEKHQQEVEQLHWSFNKLKSTMNYPSLLSQANSMNNSSKHSAYNNDNDKDRGESLH